MRVQTDSLRPIRQTHRRLIPRRLSPVRRRLANVTRPPIDANDDGDAISDVAVRPIPFLFANTDQSCCGD